MTSVFCTRPPLSVYKSPRPTGCWCGGSGSLNRRLHVPHPQLLASEIKQTFLSTNLAFLLAFGWWAARPHTHSFGNIYTLLCVCVCVPLSDSSNGNLLLCLGIILVSVCLSPDPHPCFTLQELLSVPQTHQKPQAFCTGYSFFLEYPSPRYMPDLPLYLLCLTTHKAPSPWFGFRLLLVVQSHQFFGAQPSLWSKSHIHTWLLGKL